METNIAIRLQILEVKHPQFEISNDDPGYVSVFSVEGSCRGKEKWKEIYESRFSAICIHVYMYDWLGACLPTVYMKLILEMIILKEDTEIIHTYDNYLKLFMFL